MKKLIRNSILTTLSIGVIAPAFGGSININGAEVLRVGCNAGSVACFAILASPVGPAVCSKANVAFDATTASGKNALATLLTIKAAGFTANITVDDTECAGTGPKLLAVTAN
jgi:hypothetical protein